MNYREQTVVEGLKRGDNRAYKHIYDCYYVMLCKIAFTFLKDDFLAQTIVDDLIVNIYEKRETLQIFGSFRSYLVQSVRNRCLNYLQLKQQKFEINFSDMEVSDDWLLSISNGNDTPIAALLENELEQEIRQSVERLPAECRAVFEKSRFEEKNYEDIATELNISVNTVKYHIKNALLRLRKDLGKVAAI